MKIKNILIGFLPIYFFLSLTIALPQDQDKIQVLVRGDDMGFCHGVNEACLKAYKEGILKSVEVISPGPWFIEAAKMLKENPGLDVGVHLCLTCEWENYKWRPLTYAPSISDEDGYFFPLIWKEEYSYPGSYLLSANPQLDEVEKEFRAQIMMAKKHIPQLSHMSAHMGCVMASPEIKVIAEKLAKEFNLPLELPELKGLGFGEFNITQEQKESELIKVLSSLKPGNYLFLEHPGIISSEMNALNQPNGQSIAKDRAGITYALTSEKVKQVIKDKKIQLISYASFIKQKTK